MTSQDEKLRVLLVDDNATNPQVLTQTLRGTGHKLLAAKSGKDALAIVRTARPALILLDIMMPEMDGYQTCLALKEDPELNEIPVIFLSALDDAKDKVRGFECGAVDYISKPFQAEEVVARVTTHLALARAKAELAARNGELELELAVAREIHKETLRRHTGVLLGDSTAIQAMRTLIDAFADRDDPVVIYGPSGAGDGTLARELHEQSSRRHRAFIVADCSALLSSNQGSLLASVDEEISSGRTKFDLAHGGTLFLENIHQLLPVGQGELREILQDAEAAVARGEDPSPNVRFLVSTRLSIAEGLLPAGFDRELRQLLTRNIVSLPTLAERRDDIPVLAQFFVKRHARRIGKVIDRISDDSMERLLRYSWPRNIRELEEVIQHSIVLAQDGELHVEPALLEEGIPLGSYRLVEKLGVGGMGEVWRAKHKLLARPAAIKLVLMEVSEERLPSNERAVRFKREAMATASLSSPHTVKLYDFGVSEQGEFFYVMELLEGMDLEALVRRHGAIPPERAVHFLIQACRSLGEAHGAGLVHRDIKPTNLFAARLGLELDFLKVLDFGIVSAREGSEEPSVTVTDSVTGTPLYMPPEAVTNGTAAVGPSGDVYSLGCVAYWLLTGKLVFEGSRPIEVMMKHVQEQPEPLSQIAGQSIPPELERLVHRCLAKLPQDRPSVQELAAALQAIPVEDPWSTARAEEWWRGHEAHSQQPLDGSQARRVRITDKDR